MLDETWITIEAFTKDAAGFAGRVIFGRESFVIEDDNGHGALARIGPIVTSTIEIPTEILDRYRRSAPEDAHRSDAEVLHRAVAGYLEARGREAKV